MGRPLAAGTEFYFYDHGQEYRGSRISQYHARNCVECLPPSAGQQPVTGNRWLETATNSILAADSAWKERPTRMDEKKRLTFLLRLSDRTEVFDRLATYLAILYSSCDRAADDHSVPTLGNLGFFYCQSTGWEHSRCCPVLSVSNFYAAFLRHRLIKHGFIWNH